MPKANINAKILDAALAQGVKALLARQGTDGSWNAREDAYPLAAATHLVCAHFNGSLDQKTRSGLARYLVQRQGADGGFPPNVAQAKSDFSSTAMVIAALTVAGSEPQALAHAESFLGAQGGMARVLKRLFSHSDQAALYCAMVGLIDAKGLPSPHLSFLLVPPVMDHLQKHLNGGVIMAMISMAAITRQLLADAGHRPNLVERVLHRLEARAAIAFTLQFQNPTGNWNGVTLQTDLTAAGLFALGLDGQSSALTRAFSWLDAQCVEDADGVVRITVFTSQVWTTAFSLRALLHGGVARNDAQITKGLDYLLETQTRLPMPVVDQPRPGAARTGGWAFEPDNPIMPDCDDTGTVLSALGLALERDHDAVLDEQMQNDVQNAVDRALPQLLDMQSPSGGWSGFVYGLPEKAPGPMFTKPKGLPTTVFGQIGMLISPPVELGNPPVEGLSGRVLWGLGAVGYSAQSPVVRQAERFLREQQASNGGWWGRWLVNYLAATASVLGGLASTRARQNQSYIQDAIAFLERHQNDDGGFGETPASYQDPLLAGTGPSMAALTGLVTTALLLLGRKDTPAVERAIQFLIDTQTEAGDWGGEKWMQVYQPPNGFYWFEGGRWFHPVEALALYKSPPRPPDPKKLLAPLLEPPPWPTLVRKAGTWPRSWLVQLRAHGDPVADNVVTAIWKRGDVQAVHDVMGALVRSDLPLPPGLPEEARDYFQATEALPPDFDAEKITRAQALFERHGWAACLGLFCSSLPQAYCAANGARVLLLTRGMTQHVYRRILETAQFLLDTVTPDALAAGGRGIRSAQKVRLMHASIRHLALLGEEWDTHDWGVPINQEDLAGTLMTFSVVVLDAMERIGVPIDHEDREAWLYLWKALGHFLGLNPALLPIDVADGQALMAAIRQNQWAASQQGHLLAEALVDCVDGFLPTHLFDRIPVALIRHLAGDRCADLLNLPSAHWEGMLIDGATVLEEFLGPLEDDAPKIMQWFSMQMMEALINVQREGKQTGFRIPEALLRGWSLDN